MVNGSVTLMIMIVTRLIGLNMVYTGNNLLPFQLGEATGTRTEALVPQVGGEAQGHLPQVGLGRARLQQPYKRARHRQGPRQSATVAGENVHVKQLRQEKLQPDRDQGKKSV